jgi:hypothetical protein
MDDKKRRGAPTDADRLVIQKRNQEHLPGHQKELVGTADAEDSRSKGLKRGFAIDFSHKPIAFYLASIILADKASCLAFV